MTTQSTRMTIRNASKNTASTAEQVRQTRGAELEAIARYRRVTNYLAAAQVYLKDNVLLLHLNGYKISNPTISGTMSDDELLSLFTGYGYQVQFVEGDDLDAALYGALDWAYQEIRHIQQAARSGQPTGAWR